jgi:hypothetical protein
MKTKPRNPPRQVALPLSAPMAPLSPATHQQLIDALAELLLQAAAARVNEGVADDDEADS